MPEDVILVIRLRVKESSKEEVKSQVEDFVNDFLDENEASLEGEIGEMKG